MDLRAAGSSALAILFLLTAAPIRASVILDPYLSKMDAGVLHAMRPVFTAGQSLGNHPERISRVGDSISANGDYYLSEESFSRFAEELLKDKSDFFHPNFGKRACMSRSNVSAVAAGTENGCSACSGKTLGWLLAAADGASAPIDAELDEYKPTYA